jgi:hypothetical protein
MNDFRRYLELIVDPTFKEYQLNPRSVRHAFIACVVIYHAIDRAAPGEKSVGNLRKDWGNEFFPFKYVDIVAHHLKHIESDDEKPKGRRLGIPIGLLIGFGAAGDDLELHNAYFMIRDAVGFLHRKLKEKEQR